MASPIGLPHVITKPRFNYALVWITFYAVCLAIASLVFFYELPLPEDTITLSKAEFVPTDTADFTSMPIEGWSATTLPDNWRDHEERSGKTVSGWYKVNLDIEKLPNELWAILVSSSRMNVAVYLNEKLLGDGGRFADPVARNWMTPLFFSIPSGLLNTGGNTIYVHLKADQPGMGFLPQLHLAPHDKLESSYNSHYFFRISSVQIITILLFVQSAGIGLLWYIRKRETYYGYYAMGTFLWGLHNLNIFVVNIPMSTLLWDWIAFCSLGFYAFTSMLFFHRFFNRTIPKIEIPILTFAFVCSIALFFSEGKTFYFIALSIWYPMACLAGFYGTLYLIFNAWKYRNTELQIIAASGIVTMSYATHDMLVRHNLVNWEDGFYIQFAAGVLLLGFAIILLRRFAFSLDETEALNQDLEKRVDEKHQELKKNLESLQTLENDRIRAEERERLILDMHDGMGGSLVSTLAMIEIGNASMDKIADALRSSLDDMHLMINAMDIQEDELHCVLGYFKSRISPKLENSNIKIEWEIEDIPSLPELNPRCALHILRILQETFTNIIKHAHANKISFSVKLIDEEKKTFVSIEICDNGSGIKEKSATGRGVANMQQRARSINSEFLIDSSASGTKVRLLIPFTGSLSGIRNER